ncbi:hypothetical protein V6N12_009837 [Hibiscus sabdariffa]|uniref:Uncharacterized protein n=1 Tax=Hibiscus sabdariffa TaxID=183260 RepID=A0ABR2ECD1_9ROSI
MAPRKTKLQKPGVEKDMKVKAKMGRIKQNGECLREEQRRIRAKFGEMERKCDRLKEETESIIKQTAGTQIKLALMFNILKAREGGDFIEATKLTKFLREIVAKERAGASFNDIKNENSGDFILCWTQCDVQSYVVDKGSEVRWQRLECHWGSGSGSGSATPEESNQRLSLSGWALADNLVMIETHS